MPLIAPPRTTTPDPLAEIAASVSSLVRAVERRAPTDPAAVAFRSALRRKGEEALHAFGPDALADLAGRIREAGPDAAEARGAILSAAWQGLSEPRR